MYFIRQVSSNDYPISNRFRARARRFDGIDVEHRDRETRKYRGSRKELDEREWKRDLADAFHNRLGTWSWLTRALPFSAGLCSSIAYKPQFAVNPARVAGSSRYNAFALRLSKPPVPGIGGKFYSSAFFSSLPCRPSFQPSLSMHVPSVSDYKTNRGGRKKKSETEREGEKNCIVWKKLSYPPPRKSNFSISLFLQTCCFANDIVVPLIKINDPPFIAHSVSIRSASLISERFGARSFNKRHRHRKKPDVARILANHNNCTLPRGRSIYLWPSVSWTCIYTRPPPPNCLSIYWHWWGGTEMGVGEYSESLGDCISNGGG